MRRICEVGKGIANRYGVGCLHEQECDGGAEEDDVAVFIGCEVFMFKVSRICQRGSVAVSLTVGL